MKLYANAQVTALVNVSFEAETVGELRDTLDLLFGNTPPDTEEPVATPVEKKVHKLKLVPKEPAAPVEIVSVDTEGRSIEQTDISTALRNLARAKNVPAATKAVAGFKKEDGSAVQYVKDIQPKDYPAVLAKIEELSK